jgi:hypothetical protein
LEKENGNLRYQVDHLSKAATEKMKSYMEGPYENIPKHGGMTSRLTHAMQESIKEEVINGPTGSKDLGSD